ncbi:MAG: hypothetical protein ACI9JN_000671 [Bacteroidia bacterium]|jgi:hypothetical protein
MNKLTLTLTTLLLLTGVGVSDAQQSCEFESYASFYFIDTYNNEVKAFSTKSGTWSAASYGCQDKDIQISTFNE